MKVVRSSDLSFVPASHEDPGRPGVLKKVLCVRNDLAPGRIQMINWAHLPAGESFRLHYHEDMLEVFVIVSGQARIKVDSEEAILGPQDAVIIPAMAKHEMTNLSDQATEYIAIGVGQERGGRTMTA